jgi:hypothetical protein
MYCTYIDVLLPSYTEGIFRSGGELSGISFTWGISAFLAQILFSHLKMENIEKSELPG